MTFVSYFLFELHLRFRNPAQIFFIFIFPLFLMVAFASSFGKSIPHYIESNIATIMFYGVLSAAIPSLSVQIAEYQSGKIYQLFSQRGIKRLTYVLAQILSFMLIIFLSTLAVLLVAHLAYSYELPDITTLAIFYGKLYLYAVPFYFIAMIIGMRVKNSATASAVALPVMFISYFLAGMMVPLAELSGNIRHIANHFFLTQLLSDLTHTLTGNYTIVPNWSLIAESVLILLILALLSYRKSI
ncbi:ABC transporter permease [Lactococcus nasutitermitis]|uniref:ABC transporter permease n=1 Tax=Lactococcus nasutitermitis TaxID=1652957 RepID=A0ABV9JBF6_9LACT|nr:ABC transporter permease [Lactococcus nasutitermitis]